MPYERCDKYFDLFAAKLQATSETLIVAPKQGPPT